MTGIDESDGSDGIVANLSKIFAYYISYFSVIKGVDFEITDY